MSSTTPDSMELPGKRTNWPLIIGLSLIAGIVILAIWGPAWAPKDPREKNLIIQIDGQWYTPPYRAFTKGYPLGSDNLGRDLFSWLLWSVRPTMILVLIVAALRMSIGVVLGVMAGYSDRLPGKIADMLIAAALSAPALIASIMVITAVGFHLGVWAFVLGLAATGWAETASLVRERTRTIRAQQAVEASVALGASSSQTFFLHIMPQVMPMVWMLLAFEVSNTLVATAGLGFLGYYLGGAVFQEVDDFVYQRIADMPELGQMLATAWMVLDEPWAMVAAGTVVFIIVLAFNLLGEGLQSRLTRKLGGSRNFYLTMAGSVVPWWGDHISVPVQALMRKRAFQLFLVGLLAVAAYFGFTFLSSPDGPAGIVGTATTTPQPTATVSVDAGTETGQTQLPLNAFSSPGGHYWANETNDPWKTRSVDYTGPTTDTVQWSFKTQLGFTGGPAVDVEGTLYIAARDQDEDGQDTGLLYAITSTGSEIWQASLPAKPVGTPALSADGTLYVCDKEGVSAFDADGKNLWRFDIEIGKTPVAGPVVSPNGDLYIKAYDGMWALKETGEISWHTPLTDTATAIAPHLSPDGDLVFWQDLIFNSSDGTMSTWNDTLYAPDIPLDQIIVGADGELYRRFGEVIVSQVPTDTAASDAVFFDGSLHTWDASDAGVTSDGRPWLLGRPSHGTAMGLGFYWGVAGNDEEVSGRFSVPQARNVQVLAVDRSSTAYACMDFYDTDSSCVAIEPEGLTARLRFHLPGVKALAGSALVPGRLYVATRDGTLFAIGDDVIAQDGTIHQDDNTVKTLSTWDSPDYPGGHYWSHQKADPWGTRNVAFSGPSDAQVMWMMENGAGYESAPVVASDGTIYANTTDNRLIAYAPDGSYKWAARLYVGAVGSPAIGPDGTIYITDEAGNLLAYEPSGDQKWRFHASGELVQEHYSGSGELLREEVFIMDGLGPAGTGPMVAPDGTIFFTLAVRIRSYPGLVVVQSEVLLAVTPEGQGLYADPSFVWTGRQTPRLSANDTWLLLYDHLLVPRTEIEPAGSLIQAMWDSQEAFYEEEDHDGVDMLLATGADGGVYRAYRRTLERYVIGDDGLILEPVYEWGDENSPGTIVEVGATRDGTAWMFFRNGTFAWVLPDGTLSGPVRFPLESFLFGLDQSDIAYGCGSSMGRAPECMAFAPGVEESLWQITLMESEKVAGGALAPGVVYVTTEQGRLYALGTP